MTSTPPSKLPFVSVGDGIWLLKGDSAKATDSDALLHPTVVLICGWMGAQLPHLHKYTQVYYNLYPGATQLLIQSEPAWFFSSWSTNERKMRPAVEVLSALGCFPPTKQRILVHSFSNGGSLQLTTLARLLPQSKGEKLPISAFVIDSAPGKADLASFNLAFTAQIRPKSLRLFSTLITTIVYGFLYLLQLLGIGGLDPAVILRKALLNERFLPWIDKRTPRLLIYSKGDQLVKSDHVQEHIEACKNAGLNVQEDLYESTPHVSHARLEPERYWARIKAVWEEAIKVYSTR